MLFWTYTLVLKFDRTNGAFSTFCIGAMDHWYLINNSLSVRNYHYINIRSEDDSELCRCTTYHRTQEVELRTWRWPPRCTGTLEPHLSGAASPGCPGSWVLATCSRRFSTLTRSLLSTSSGHITWLVSNLHRSTVSPTLY